MEKTLELPREVTGNDLVEIIKQASKMTGFRFYNHSLFLCKTSLEKQQNDGVSDYSAEKAYHEMNKDCAFDATPYLNIKFPGIDLHRSYSMIRSIPRLGTMKLFDVDIEKELEFKPDYDALVSKITELAKQIKE